MAQPCLSDLQTATSSEQRDPDTPFRAPGALANRSSVWVLWLALAVLACFHLRYLPTQLAHYTDPVIYLSGAESLANGEGYHFATHVGNMRIGCHPPLHAAYLSLFCRLYPEFP